uniref:Uncharacterized protein n=1 Tax=Vitis vinifera TaxID=29760 RepID=F6GZP1_VITVI
MVIRHEIKLGNLCSMQNRDDEEWKMNCVSLFYRDRGKEQNTKSCLTLRTPSTTDHTLLTTHYSV